MPAEVIITLDNLFQATTLLSGRVSGTPQENLPCMVDKEMWGTINNRRSTAPPATQVVEGGTCFLSGWMKISACWEVQTQKRTENEHIFLIVYVSSIMFLTFKDHFGYIEVWCNFFEIDNLFSNIYIVLPALASRWNNCRCW